MEYRTCIHVGLERCGSTFLQEKVFPYMPNFDYAVSKEAQRIVHQAVSSTKYDLHALALAGSEISRKQQGHIIISMETLAGRPALSFHDRKKNIEIIKTLFPTAEIYIVLRDQFEYCISHHKLALYKGSLLAFDSYITGYQRPEDAYQEWQNRLSGLVEEKANSSFGCCNYKTLDWNVLVTDFGAAFGDDSIHAILLENLFKTTVFQTTIFCNFFQLDGNMEIVDKGTYINKLMTNTHYFSLNLALQTFRFFGLPTGSGREVRWLSWIIRLIFKIRPKLMIKYRDMIQGSLRSEVKNFHSRGNRQLFAERQLNSAHD